MEETVSDLEALRDMSEEVEEQHVELTRHLTTELDFAKAEANEKVSHVQGRSVRAYTFQIRE